MTLNFGKCRPVAIFLLLFLVAQTQAGRAAGDKPVEVYVATNGSDENTGAVEAPFATLQRARDELRQRKSTFGLPLGAIVFVRSGTYYLDTPLALGPEDSGSESGAMVYSAYPGEKVELKGSRIILGWKPFRKNIWQANLDGINIKTKRPWQLFYRGERQVLARFPNFDPAHPRSGGFLYVTATQELNTKTNLHYDPKLLDPSKWQRPQEVRLNIWPWRNWNRDICTIKAVDQAAETIELGTSARYQIIEGNRFFAENALEELDAPGEWYLDLQTNVIYFWPPNGDSPDDNASIPILSSIVDVQGDTNGRAYVIAIEFRHISMSESHENLVAFSHVKNCVLIGASLKNCGGTAITLTNSSQDNRIANCDISHCGGPGVVIAGERDWTYSLEARTSYNGVLNNHIQDIGELGNALGAIVISPADGGNVSHHNLIAHNLIHDVPRQGIYFNGFTNVVEFNEVHHTNQEQSDTGAIGMESRDIHERGSIIRYNYIHDTGGFCMLKPGQWAYPYYSWGIYLDDYTSGVLVYGNLIVRSQRGAIEVHGGQDNVIKNNIIVDSTIAQVEFDPIDSLVDNRTPDNPDKSLWLMTGTQLIGNVFSYGEAGALWLIGRKWDQVLVESDRNLLWVSGQTEGITISGFPALDGWKRWQALGRDQHSLIATPLFLDATRDNFRLNTNSPAFNSGFQALPIDEIGIQDTPDRASWPVNADRTREHYLLQVSTVPNAPTKLRIVAPSQR